LKRLVDYLKREIRFFLLAVFVFIVILEPLDGGIAEEAAEVDINDPEVMVGKHQIDPSIYLHAELHMFDVYFNVFDFTS
jgi:hypothetical protein